jgi:hypothetical protein
MATGFFVSDEKCRNFVAVENKTPQYTATNAGKISLI